MVLGVNLSYFKLRVFNLTEFIVENIQGLWVAKIGIRKSKFVSNN